MTDDSLTVAGQSHLTDAFLWLVGAPLCLLDALYLSRLAPPPRRSSSGFSALLPSHSWRGVSYAQHALTSRSCALLPQRRAQLHVSSSAVAAPVSRSRFWLVPEPAH